MFSLLESELMSRSFIQAARMRLRPSSALAPRTPDGVSRSSVEASRPCSSQSEGKAPGSETTFKVDKGLILPTGQIKAAPAVQPSSARGYATRGSPASQGSSGPSRGQPLQPSTSLDIQSFLQARPFEDIPGPTALHQSIPFAGTRMLYYPFSEYPVENMSDMVNKLQAVYGPIMRIKFDNSWIVVIEDLCDIGRLVRAAEEESNTNACDKELKPKSSGMMGALRKRVGDPALSWLGGSPRTQRLRAEIAHHLNSQLTKDGCLSKQDQMGSDLVRCLDEVQQNAESMQQLFYRYSLECVTQMCFNKRLGLLKEPVLNDESLAKLVDSYRTVVKCLGEAMTGTRVLHMLFEDPFAKRFKDAQQIVLEWERALLRGEMRGECPEIPQAQKAEVGDEACLLKTLQQDKTLSSEEMANALHAIITIGTDSVSSTLQMALYALATNTESQDKLAAEILNVTSPEKTLKACDLESMEYLKAAIKESLRINFPMVAGGRAILSKNIVLSDYLVPAKTSIVVNSRRTAKNPAYFDHPLQYRPERWIGEEAKKIPTLAYMPFGFGANHCPSRAFSLQELHVAIIKILQKFKVNLPMEYQHKKIETSYALFRSPQKPLPFYFTKRGEQKC